MNRLIQQTAKIIICLKHVDRSTRHMKYLILWLLITNIWRYV